jgi:heptosyltransferase-1
MIDNPRRLLIVRLSALGDIVFTTSLLETLRRAYPEAHISWIAQSTFAGILQNDTRLNELIVIEKSVLGSPAGLLALRRQLRAKKFDLVIDAQGTLKSNVISALAGSYRAGFAAKKVGKMLISRVISKGGDIRDISSEYRFLAQTITGLSASPPSLVVDDVHQQEVVLEMQKNEIKPGFVALCPFTTRPEKHWIAENWSQLADLLRIEGMQCVLFGGPGNVETSRKIAADAPASLVNLTGQTKLESLPAWFSRAGLVIGVDTGLTHIGVATKRPVIVLFGATCPYTQGANSPLKVLSDPPKDEHWKCMNGLTPQMVLQAVREMREIAV